MQVLSHFIRYSLGLAEAETQTSDAERACLRRHARDRKRLVEIGVWHGVTTSELLRSIPEDGTLFAVDPFPPGRFRISLQQVIARREVAKVGRGSVRWLRTTGALAARELAAAGEPPVDFVFIDGDHSYAGLSGDWSGWVPLVAPGGIVALHDSRSTDTRRIDDAGSVIFTREVVLSDPRFEVVEEVDTLTVLRRRSDRATTTVAAERYTSSAGTELAPDGRGSRAEDR